jgi:potassium channel subfamily K
VISIIGSGIITFALAFHYVFAFGKKGEDTAEVRSEGRKFMLSVTAFFAILAVQALVFCKIETWLYSDAICEYVSRSERTAMLIYPRFLRVSGRCHTPPSWITDNPSQTALTIGYGDLTPTTTAGKVLIFPFSVLTISQLGNEIALIIGFISARAEARRDKWRSRYEGAMHREANRLRPKASLIEEMALIHQINNREEM